MHAFGCALLAGLIVLNAWSFGAQLQHRAAETRARRVGGLGGKHAWRIALTALGVGGTRRIRLPA